MDATHKWAKALASWAIGKASSEFVECSADRDPLAEMKQRSQPTGAVPAFKTRDEKLITFSFQEDQAHI